jgi:4'-phosphopantetheinyl transferase EntD
MPTFLSNINRLTITGSDNVCLKCQFNIDIYQDELFDEFNIYFPESLAKAVPKRKAEFLAGRIVVREAMKIMALPMIDIPIGMNRAPCWPEGVVGSITHSGNQVFCILSKKNNAIGIDYEEVISGEDAANIQRSIVSEEEVSLFGEVNSDYNKVLTLAFSAKESLFKALYFSVRKYFDFLDVTIISFQDELSDDGSSLLGLTLEVNTDLNEDIRKGRTFNVLYQWQDAGVLTFISINL